MWGLKWVCVCFFVLVLGWVPPPPQPPTPCRRPPPPRPSHAATRLLGRSMCHLRRWVPGLLWGRGEGSGVGGRLLEVG